MCVEEFIWRNFTDLSLQELYSVLKLRSKVFVVEQKCIYLDLDDKDETARHLLVKKDGALVAYVRVQPPTDICKSVKGERFVVEHDLRRAGLGHRIISELRDEICRAYGSIHVDISAQAYLENYYRKLGFERISEEYDDHGVTHVKLRLFLDSTLKNNSDRRS